MNNNPFQKTGRAMFILTWLMIFALLFIFFHFQEQVRETRSEVIRAGKLILTADRSGHYRVNGSINQVKVDLLVDTGATMVAVSQSLADKMKLTARYPITIRTASGASQGYLTRIEQLRFGGFEFSHVKAVILSNLDDDMALLGMNILSEFNISQQDGQLILER